MSEDIGEKLKDVANRVKKALPTEMFEQASRIDVVIDGIVFVIKDRWGSAPRIDHRA